MNESIVDILTAIAKSIISPVIAGSIIGLIVSWQARRNLRKRDFRDRINFSLNSIQNDTLQLRTLMEKPCADVFPSLAITKIVRQAADKTTEADCILPIPEKQYWQCLNALLNEVSEKFAHSFIQCDLDPSTRSGIYVMCITCEKSKAIRTQKIRAMLIRESLLSNFPGSDPHVEAETHNERITTLRHLAKAYKRNPNDYRFVKIQLSC